jgi:uncharacterized membrane protein (UPF0127 family)
MQIRNVTRETIVCTEATLAQGFLARLRGLMGRRAMPPGSGLLLVPEYSIHTFGMRFSIDVFYLDDDCRVLRLQEAMPPNRIGPIVRGCKAILETPVGTIRQSRTQIGDLLALESRFGDELPAQIAVEGHSRSLSELPLTKPETREYP